MLISDPMHKLVIGILKNKIPSTYFYHQVTHTLKVISYTQEIGQSENCNPVDLLLLYTAALWHDTGFAVIYEGHEEESCKLVKKNLPYFNFSHEDIIKICGMIMATKIPQKPLTNLEKIMADADLAYLGDDKATELAYNLFKELKGLQPLLTKEVWRKTEINFLKNHQYFTNYCKEKKQPGKQRYLNSLLLENPIK